jgi:pantothenate kinase
VFVKAPLEVLKARLLERWRDQHLSPQEAQQKVTENDLPNAALVLQESMSADLVIEHAVHDALVQVS